MNGTPQILIVEDSPTQALRLQLELERQHWTAICVGNANEALAQIQVSPPDAMLVDYFLPGMSGDELCRRVRMNINTRAIPIIMLTADESEDTEVRGLDSGADDFFKKSADTDILVIRIRAVLDRPKCERSVLLQNESAFRRATVLAVDDSETYLSHLTCLLKEEGYSVDCVTDPIVALRRLETSSYDLAIVDLVMPDMDGIEVCRQIIAIRKRLDNPIAILMLTGQEAKEDLTHALEAGADDFVGKSSDHAVLKGRIRALLRRKFFQQENQRISNELKNGELEAASARAETEAALARAANERREQAETVAIALGEAKAELETANSLLEQKNVRLAQLCETAQKVVENVSHEFRTPLTVIREFTSIILDGLDGRITDMQEKHLKKVLHRTDDLTLMVDDMLDISRLEAGLLGVRRRECQARDMIDNVVGLLRSRAASKNITLSPNIPDNLPSTFCDEEKARRVIMNLTVNAIKFTPDNGKVNIWARPNDSKSDIEIGITDNGPGISKDNLEIIFERFRQVDAGLRSSTKGFGLGLNIAKELVALNLGRIKVDSQLFQGSTFSFTVPTFDPRIIMERVYERTKSAGRSVPDVSLLAVDVVLDNSKMVAVVDEFLQRSVRPDDLVMPAHDGRWVIAAACSEGECGHLIRRLEMEWSEDARNCPQFKLPPLHIEHRKTWHPNDTYEALLNSFLSLFANEDTELRSTPTVLVVDDDQEVRQCLSQRLNSAGFKVITASDGEEGIASALANTPSAIVLDVRMPKMDGLTALRELRAHSTTKRTPVIMLSASIQDQQCALRSGASFFVRKPYDSDEVLSAIESTMREAVL
jgi:DNA-binding response OmpR family regulator